MKKKLHQYINPEAEFDPFNINFSGISPEMVKDSPTFPEILHLITDELSGGDDVVVAHNAPFDISVIDKTCGRYGIPRPEFDYYCTYSLAKAMLPGLARYKLPIVASACSVPMGIHHQADDDAEASGRIFIHLCQEANVNDLWHLRKEVGVTWGHLSKDGVYGCHKTHECRKIVVPNDPYDLPNQVIPGSEFFGKTVVFTGTMKSMTREHAGKLITAIGGTFSDAITRKTNYLVTGYLDPRITKSEGKSTKILKVEKLASEGIDIQILSEEDFVMML